MAVSAPDKVTIDNGTPEAQPPAKVSRPHSGPVSRLLAKVSKWSMEYAEYHYDRCDWRRIAI